MKKLIVTLLVILSLKISNAQDVKKQVQTFETKMDKFTSKTGAFFKFVDYKMPTLKVNFGSGGVQTRIRKVINGSEAVYFYQIEKAGQYSKSTASIEYLDLLEVIKALNSLKTEVEKDVADNPDYLENKFITVDGFQVGYYIDKSKINWYLTLEKYGTDNSVFVKDELTIESAFRDAETKIEELKR